MGSIKMDCVLPPARDIIVFDWLFVETIIEWRKIKSKIFIKTVNLLQQN